MYHLFKIYKKISSGGLEVSLRIDIKIIICLKCNLSAHIMKSYQIVKAYFIL